MPSSRPGSRPRSRPSVLHPFRRWPRRADAVLAVVLFVSNVVVVEGEGDAPELRSPTDVPLGYLVLLAVGSLVLAWRRRAPLTVLVVTVAVSSALLGNEEADLGGAVLVAAYTVGRYAPGAPWPQAAAAAATAVVTVDVWLDPGPWQEAVFAGVVTFAGWDVGVWLRRRAARRDQRLREKAAEEQRVLVEERSRIARELHDVVAHRVSLMTVQAGAARAVAPTDLASALRAMAAVEDAGREALTELRHLLGVLRPQSEQQGLGPQPGLGDLPALVEEVRRTGRDVALVQEGVPAVLPEQVELFAYRIVQEALTNVLKHAGPSARVEVRLCADGRSVRVEVEDDGSGARPVAAGTERSPAAVGAPPPGHGLVGMRERSLLLGGRFDAGPRPGGGFRVAAVLPIRGEA